MGVYCMNLTNQTRPRPVKINSIVSSKVPLKKRDIFLTIIHVGKYQYYFIVSFFFSITLYVCVCFKHRGPTHSLHHPTSLRGPTHLLPGAPAPTLNPPESLMSNSELHFNWWSTQVRNGQYKGTLKCLT